MATEIKHAETTNDEDGSLRVVFHIVNEGGGNTYEVGLGAPLPSEENAVHVARHLMALDLAEAARVSAGWILSADKLKELRS